MERRRLGVKIFMVEVLEPEEGKKDRQGMGRERGV